MEVTLETLIDDINQSKSNEYLFLRVLNNTKDQELFLSKLSKEHYNEIFQTKQMKLSAWLHIMNIIQSKLSINYTIYRKAYVGENKGDNRIQKQLSNYVIPLWSFRTKQEKVSNFRKYFREFMGIKQPTRQILLNKSIMEHFDFKASNYRLSSWENLEYDFEFRKNEMLLI